MKRNSFGGGFGANRAVRTLRGMFSYVFWVLEVSMTVG